MKSILAYGDSLTWGFIPGTGERHDHKSRWPSVLSSELGAEVEIITDGLCGRTTAYDEYTAECNRNGSQTLPTALEVHAPLDLVILMLGTNDLQPHIAGSALAARLGMKRLINIINARANSKTLIVSPPFLIKSEDELYGEYFAGTIEQSHLFAAHYASLAEEYNCTFFDAAAVCEASPIDGVHMDAENTRKLGVALASTVREILN